MYHCTDDTYVADSREVVLSNLVDWKGVIDVEDVAFVFHAEHIQSGLAYTYGMKNAYSIRYTWDTRKHKVEKLTSIKFSAFLRIGLRIVSLNVLQ